MMLKYKILFLVFLCGLLLFPGAGFAVTDEDCFACHYTVDSKKYGSSMHGANGCVSCHDDVTSAPHAAKPKKVSCENCHSGEAEAHKLSDHSKASGGASSCLDCHGNAHSILPSSDAASPVFRKNIPEMCARCHEDEKKMSGARVLETKPLKSYSQTVHGRAMKEKGFTQAAICTDCHGSHDLDASSNPKSRLYRINVPSTCGKCHQNIFEMYEKSIHGKVALVDKRDEAPVCTDCHGEHTIESHLSPTSSVYATRVSKETCGRCHAAEKIASKYHIPADRLDTYLKSYHGLANRYGMTMVANCASCHGAHNILPSNDPGSMVNKTNLSRTCGRCHPEASDLLAKGSVHVAPTSTNDRIVFFVKLFYILLIVGVIGGMLFHNVLDFLPKIRECYRRKRESGEYVRFTRNERFQHLALMISFIVLAYTGFALRYPDAWWAMPFSVVVFGIDIRGIVHRAMAVVFILLGIYHIGFMSGTRRGRGQIKALLPRVGDVGDLMGTLKYNLGFAKEKPQYPRYNYAEKAEYWALVWGALIMVVTGAILTFEGTAMKYFPKWVLDVALVIHHYEAVLATLAIVVWHLYFIIFFDSDPTHYSINLSMFTGKVPEHEKRLEDHLDEGGKNPDKKS